VLLSLALPIVLSTVALFFSSFLSWMVLQLHKKDWGRVEKEDQLMEAVGKCNLPVGSYMFPCPVTPAEMQAPEFQKKYDAGPRGVLTILPKVNMGVNLGLTVLYFFAVSVGLGCLATIAFRPGAGFLEVFGLVFMAGFMTFLAAMVQHTIWFRPRIVGHLIESVAYAAIAGVLFAALWPAK
jgi:hypothetical protein